MRLKNIVFLLVLATFSVSVLYANDGLAKLRARISGLKSSFSAKFAYTSSNGTVKSGKIYYQSPNKMHLKMSDGRVIATNGRFMWIYNPASVICAKQEVGGKSRGILSLVRSYNAVVTDDTFVFTRKDAYYDQIVVTVSKNMLRSVKLRHNSEVESFSFSNVQVGRGIKASLFNFRPPTSVRIVENPLNR